MCSSGGEIFSIWGRASTCRSEGHAAAPKIVKDPGASNSGLDRTGTGTNKTPISRSIGENKTGVSMKSRPVTCETESGRNQATGANGDPAWDDISKRESPGSSGGDSESQPRILATDAAVESTNFDNFPSVQRENCQN